jgi:hypothetical protein
MSGQDIALSYMTDRRPSIQPHQTSDTIVNGSIASKDDDRSDSDITECQSTDQVHHAQEFSLPPVDGGLNAYLVLISGFCIEGVVWGIPFSYSVMQQVSDILLMD